jgi:5,10-methylenetetrahydromethanopterin reductase
MVSGTVLDPGEDRRSLRVRDAIGPWRVVGWHTAYAVGGAAAVDSKPGGEAWRHTLESMAPEDERHLLTFQGHCTHLTDRDVALLDHIDVDSMVGDVDAIRAALERIAGSGFCEVLYTPAGPDVARELGAFAAARGYDA